MTFEKDKEDSLSSLLINERLWKLEDRLNIVIASNSEHEQELIRHKRMIMLLSDRLDSEESSNAIKQESQYNDERQTSAIH